MCSASLAKFFWLMRDLWLFFCPQLLYLPFRDCPRFQELESETLNSEEFQKRLHPYKVKKQCHLVMYRSMRAKTNDEALASQKCGQNVAASGWMWQWVRMFNEGPSSLPGPFPCAGATSQERSQSLSNPIPASLRGTRWKCMAGSE